MTLSEVNFIRADRFEYYQKSRGNPSWYVSSKQSPGGSPGPNMFTSTNPELNSDYHFRSRITEVFSASLWTSSTAFLPQALSNALTVQPIVYINGILSKIPPDLNDHGKS